MAPHPNVRWQDIDPMSGPNYLSQGCAIHLGPIGRGVTFEFVRIQKLGVWQQGQLASAHEDEVNDVATAGGGAVEMAGAPVPASFQARKVTRINASTVPLWFGGGALIIAVAAVTCLGAAVLIGRITPEPLGPVIEGEVFYEYATIAVEDIDPNLKGGLRSGFHDFVMKPNGTVASPSVRRRVTNPETWDERFYEKVVASVQTHLQARSVFRRFDEIRGPYAEVVEELRAADLPEVFAAIPYMESRYVGDITSPACAKGYWQFMPEVAHRLDREPDIDFTVRDCTLAGIGVKWSPTADAPPRGLYQNAVYIRRPEHTCLIQRCDIDHRTDLTRSTRAAMASLREPMEDPTIRASGAAVQISILSHNSGYDDGRFGRPKPTNLLPALRRWSAGKSDEEIANFYGAMITTDQWVHDGGRGARLGSLLMPETQHYAYSIVAQHLLAVCYYAQNYGDDPVFSPWRQYTREDGYCRELIIPTPQDLGR
ncbi:MAG: hypothetical protein ACJAV2_003935 [Myxococcota bacterium]|jgi:hypothetical protein